MNMELKYPSGATPLDPDETTGLIPMHITTHHQLNEWEAENILSAENWLFSARNHGNFLHIEFIKLLHKKMFSDTWSWAGQFRVTERNIGVAPFKISTTLKNLLDDIHHQILHEIYPVDEIAYRLHHRMVAIHPFPNGNGRHARLITDFLLVQAGRPRFSWGINRLEAEGPTRNRYLDALRKADYYDYSALASFVRSE